MAREKKKRSIYQRTIIATFASVMVAFTILSLVFFSVMNERVYRLQSERLYSVASTVKAETEKLLESQTESRSRLQLGEEIDLLAQASNSYIWLVRNDGIFIHASAIPPEVRSQCRTLIGGLVQLPVQYVRNYPVSDRGLILHNSEYDRLFQQKEVNWITVLLPIHDQSQWQGATLQLHLPFADRYNWRWFLNNGVGMAFLVSVIISIALTLILMNDLTLPIEALAEAAQKVTLGDYSVRVKYSDIDRADSLQEVGEKDGIRRLMITFNEMVERLEAINEEQRDLIAGISHDMKTPLTSIIGFTDALLDGMIPEEKEEKYLKIIKQEASRLKNLLLDLNFDLSLSEGSPVTHEHTDFDINAVFLAGLEALEPQVTAKELAVEVHLQGDKDQQLWVTADQEQIARVIFNLISNATKFCPPRSTIRISTEWEPGALFMTCLVEDSGPGIPEPMRNQVFGRFVKLDKSRGNQEGSGLGLYISRQILAKHGQTITVKRSEDLGGARFAFTLPVAREKNEKGLKTGNKARHFVRWVFGRNKGETIELEEEAQKLRSQSGPSELPDRPKSLKSPDSPDSPATKKTRRKEKKHDALDEEGKS